MHAVAPKRLTCTQKSLYVSKNVIILTYFLVSSTSADILSSHRCSTRNTIGVIENINNEHVLVLFDKKRKGEKIDKKVSFFLYYELHHDSII